MVHWPFGACRFRNFRSAERLLTTTFQFRRAPRDLEPWVIGFAERRDTGICPLAQELPVPNPMIQIMLGGDYLIREQPVPRAALWGPAVSPAPSRTEAPARVFIVVLTALGATRLTRSDLHTLMDVRVDLGAMGRPGWAGFPELIEGASDLDSRAALTTQHLRDELSRPAPPPGRFLRLADGVLRHHVRGTVSELAAEAGLSPRGLHKALVREIGCTPKRLLRVARLQRVLRALHPEPWSPRPPEDAVLEYVDQSHLDRDFRELTGLSRSSYVIAKSTLRDQLVHTVVGRMLDCPDW